MSASPHQPPPETVGYRPREAEKSDLNGITQLHIEGFIKEPMDNYCYPLRFQHPDDHFKWIRKEYEYYLENPKKYLVHVVEDLEQAEVGANSKPVGLAVWNIAVLAEAPALDRGLGERKDAVKQNVEAYVRVANNRYKPGGLFLRWGEKQITLSVLVVLSEYRRRGIGTSMVGWGTNAATEKGWAVTLCASPLGQLLYTKLNFSVIGTEVIQVEGEEDSFSSAAMVFGADS
ncbi:hypothetical protein BX600DRAFT_470300 [Xylariales sp. PMI_506]|nr:hypothetical protein BX600DRAFT_470300 [Xylariales sp. PMI_506]